MKNSHNHHSRVSKEMLTEKESDNMISWDLGILHDTQLREYWHSFKINTKSPENPVHDVMTSCWMNKQWKHSTRCHLHVSKCSLIPQKLIKAHKTKNSFHLSMRSKAYSIHSNCKVSLRKIIKLLVLNKT